METAQRGFIEYGFLGGAQSDMYGNLNSTVIGDHDRPKVRLPGRGSDLKLRLLAFSCLLLLVTACVPRATPAPTATPSPTPTATATPAPSPTPLIDEQSIRKEIWRNLRVISPRAELVTEGSANILIIDLESPGGEPERPGSLTMGEVSLILQVFDVMAIRVDEDCPCPYDHVALRLLNPVAGGQGTAVRITSDVDHLKQLRFHRKKLDADPEGYQERYGQALTEFVEALTVVAE